MGKWMRCLLLSGFLFLMAAVVFLVLYARTLEPRLKQRVIHALADRFNAEVTLGNLRFSAFPKPAVSGDNLVVIHRGWGSDEHPLIRIKHFEAWTDYTTLLAWRNYVRRVRLEGLEIHVPPRGRATLARGLEVDQEVSSGELGADKTKLKFYIETIVADSSLLEIEPKKAGKDPLTFPIGALTMTSVGEGQPMAFTARLTNVKPPGTIDTIGRFGPWQRDDPRATAVSGEYRFERADLSVFKGIRGMLASSGTYNGVLQHIEVDGTTDVPDFSLRTGGDTVHLTTRFHSVVDGMNGDTILDPVDATFGRSEFICRGGVIRNEGQSGKTVDLFAQAEHGRIQDILGLMVGEPVVVGAVNFRSKIVIPPGDVEVADKLFLDGDFGLESAIFTSRKTEDRLRKLTDRAHGISKAEEERGEGEKGNVCSNLAARFKLDKGVASFSRLTFLVPGASIRLAGIYDLKSSKLDMKGRFDMQATLSQTQSGWKHILLKPLDPLFKHNGAGFDVPVSISGTREHPVIEARAVHRSFTIH
jgi:hypothetical protein